MVCTLASALAKVPGEPLPLPVSSLVAAQAAAVGGSRLSPALRSCLAAIGCRLVDGSNPAALRAASSDRLWAKLHSSQVPLAVVFPRSAQHVAKAVQCARQAGIKVTARWEAGPGGQRTAGVLLVPTGEWCRAALLLVPANTAPMLARAPACQPALPHLPCWAICPAHRLPAWLRRCVAPQVGRRQLPGLLGAGGDSDSGPL